MTSYTVVHCVDAVHHEDVEADSPEQAMERAMSTPSICHQCSDELGLGDDQRLIVLQAGEEVANEDLTGLEGELKKAKARIAELEELFTPTIKKVMKAERVSVLRKRAEKAEARVEELEAALRRVERKGQPMEAAIAQDALGGKVWKVGVEVCAECKGSGDWVGLCGYVDDCPACNGRGTK